MKLALLLVAISVTSVVAQVKTNTTTVVTNTTKPANTTTTNTTAVNTTAVNTTAVNTTKPAVQPTPVSASSAYIQSIS